MQGSLKLKDTSVDQAIFPSHEQSRELLRAGNEERAAAMSSYSRSVLHVIVRSLGFFIDKFFGGYSHTGECGAGS